MDQIEFTVGAKTMTIQTGRLATQSNGSVLVGCEGAAVLVTVNAAKPREGIDFFPLTVDYVEKTYAAGNVSWRSSSPTSASQGTPGPARCRWRCSPIASRG